MVSHGVEDAGAILEDLEIAEVFSTMIKNHFPEKSLTLYPSILDFWKIKLEKSILTNWIFNLFQAGFSLPVKPQIKD